MPAQNPQIIGVGISGRSDAVTAQRRVNCYLDVQEENDRARVAVYGCAGLTQLVYMGTGPVRGMHAPPDHAYMYAAHGTSLYQVANDGGLTNLGTLDTSTGWVCFATGHLNGSSERHMMLVDGTSGYYVDIAAAAPTLTKITDAEFPSNPRSCAYNNGYFIMNRGDDSGIFDISENTDDASAWDGLSFATAESKGDRLERVFSYQGVLAQLGGESTEYWTYTGDSTFPFAAQLGMRHDWGLAARASVAEFGDYGIALMRSSMGEVVVQLLHPSGPQTVSPPDLVRIINDYSTVSDAIGASFMESGHPMYLLTFPKAAKSWQYDGRTQVWCERETGADGVAYTAAHAAVLNGTVRLGGRTTGHLYTLAPGTYTDNSAVQLRQAVTEHVHLPGNAMMKIGELWVDMEVGAGVDGGAQGSAPLLMLRVSHDKGRSWGPVHTATLGAIGKFGARARFRRLGRGNDVTFEISLSDPVPFVITGVSLRIGASGARNGGRAA